MKERLTQLIEQTLKNELFFPFSFFKEKVSVGRMRFLKFLGRMFFFLTVNIVFEISPGVYPEQSRRSRNDILLLIELYLILKHPYEFFFIAWRNINF